jgi:hypothetical protein
LIGKLELGHGCSVLSIDGFGIGGIGKRDIPPPISKKHITTKKSTEITHRHTSNIELTSLRKCKQKPRQKQEMAQSDNKTKDFQKVFEYTRASSDQNDIQSKVVASTRLAALQYNFALEK